MRSTFSVFRLCLLTVAILSSPAIPAADGDEARSGSTTSATAAPNSLDRAVEAELRVSGSLRFRGRPARVPQSGLESLPLKVTAQFRYDERLENPGEPKRVLAARLYHAAEANLQIGENKMESALSADRRLLRLCPWRGEIVTFAVSGPLEREELDLLETPIQGALLETLLPPVGAKPGVAWKPAADDLAALLGWDVVTESSVSAQFESAAGPPGQNAAPTPGENGDTFFVSLAGDVAGEVEGARSEVGLKGRLAYQSGERAARSASFTWTERRAVGDARPGFEVEGEMNFKLKPGPLSPRLAEIPLGANPLDGEPDLATLALRFTSRPGRFQLLHPRGWQVMVDTPDLTVLRLLERGKLVAQCNLSRKEPFAEGESLSLQEFQSDIQKSLGDHFREFVEVSESAGDDAVKAYRVAAAGEVAGVPVRWIHHHLADRQGRRIACVFTLAADQAERFGEADQTLVDGLTWR